MIGDGFWSFVLNGLATSVIVGPMAAFVAKVIADLAIEKQRSEFSSKIERLKDELAKQGQAHELRIRQQEILLQKRLEAAKAFFALRKSIEPKYRHLDMDWDEAMNSVIENFGATETLLDDFVSEYGIFLSEENRVILEECVVNAQNYIFAARDSSDTALNEAKEVAEEMLNALRKIENQFVAEMQ